MLKTLLLIAAGGAIGAMMRFLSQATIYELVGRSFPFGTLFVNVLGSFLMGLLSHAEADLAAEIARTTGGVQKVVKAIEYVE